MVHGTDRQEAGGHRHHRSANTGALEAASIKTGPR